MSIPRPEIHLGFTGTQRGMTPQQKEVLYDTLLGAMDRNGEGVDYWIHHGDCKGSDEETHQIATDLGWKTHGHPPYIERKRAFCAFDEIEEPEDYLDRNHTIVDMTQGLVGCPHESKEIQRSGTWATIRYARNKARPVLVILPSGDIL